MAHPSKTARRKRNSNKVTSARRVLNAERKNTQLAGLAIAAHNQSAHLARMLAFVVARYGVKGRLAIPDRELATMPDGAKLREHYDVELDAIILTSVVINDSPVEIGAPPKIDIISPDISPDTIP